MPPVYKDRVLEETTTTGTGSLSLAGAVDGYQALSDVFTDGQELFYLAFDVGSDNNPDGDWEVGLGHYESTGPELLRRKLLAGSTFSRVETTLVFGTVATGTGTSISTNAPAGVQVGDELLLVIVVEDEQCNTPTGWILIDHESTSTVSCGTTIFRRTADGTADDTPAVTTASSLQWTSQIIRLVGWHTQGSYDTFAAKNTDATAAQTLPEATASQYDSIAIGIATKATASSAPTWPNGWSKPNDDISGGALISVAYKFLNAESSGAGTITFTGDSASRKILHVVIYSPPTGVNFASGTKRIACVAPAAKIKLPDIQVFTSTGSWIKPHGCTMCEVVVIGGGGGGGSGRKGATADAGRTGGGGGGAGGISRAVFRVSDLNSVELVTIGAGGTGGPSQTTNSTSGTAGTNGGSTSFGGWVKADGGTGGQGGSTTNRTAQSGGGVDSLYSVQGGTAGGCTASTGVGANGASNSVMRPTGGGGGGGLVQTTDAIGAAGAGGTLTASTVMPNAVAGGTAGSTSVGGNGNNVEFLRGLTIGTGGGGGAASATTNAFAGGNGANYGGGGGGGGGSKDSTGNSGVGGDGANGICVVFSW